jgi:hypothetical protein
MLLSHFFVLRVKGLGRVAKLVLGYGSFSPFWHTHITSMISPSEGEVVAHAEPTSLVAGFGGNTPINSTSCKTSKTLSSKCVVFDELVVFNFARLRRCDDEIVRVFFGFAQKIWEDWL